MSATLYREGSDLDELLAEVGAEHGAVRVVDIGYGRDGGVLGFFAHRRIGVHYVIDNPSADDTLTQVEHQLRPTLPERAAAVSPFESPLDELLHAADAAEMIESGRAPRIPSAPPATGSEANVEFARMLLEMAGQKAAERTRQAEVVPEPAPAARVHAVAVEPNPTPSPAPVAVPTAAGAAAQAAALRTFQVQMSSAVLPTITTTGHVQNSMTPSPRRPIGAHRAEETAAQPSASPRPGRYRDDVSASPPTHSVTPRRPAPSAQAVLPGVASEATTVARETTTRTSYTLRRQLSELGVPVDWIPEHDNAYLMIEQLVRQAPTAGDVDPEPGHLIVVAGPARHVLVEATRLCTRLRLDPARLHTAGFGENPIAHRREAVALAHRIRADNADVCVIAVATDETAAEADSSGRDDLCWAASLVSALGPDHLVVVVDATSKPTDARSMLAAFGPVSALAVVGAARTASPASLWDLGVGVMSLDGRPATRGAWAALLIDRLTELELV